MARPYRGVALVDRVAARRETLVETALDCLHDDGLSGASVRSICARARLTPRYFYESFADLDELLVAVVDAVAAEVAACAVAAVAVAPDDLAGQVRAAVDAGYGVVATDPRKATRAAGRRGRTRAARRAPGSRSSSTTPSWPCSTSRRCVRTGDRRAATATALFLSAARAS